MLSHSIQDLQLSVVVAQDHHTIHNTEAASLPFGLGLGFVWVIWEDSVCLESVCFFRLDTPSAIEFLIYQEYYWLYAFGGFKIETLIANELGKKMLEN